MKRAQFQDLVFTLDPAADLLPPVLQPHGLAMESVGGVTVIVGIIVVVASAAINPPAAASK